MLYAEEHPPVAMGRLLLHISISTDANRDKDSGSGNGYICRAIFPPPLEIEIQRFRLWNERSSFCSFSRFTLLTGLM